MIKKGLLFSLLLFIGFGCRKDDSINSEAVSISKTLVGLEVKNKTSDRLYYFAVDQNTLALIDWVPTIGNETPFIEPSSQKLIPFDDVYEKDSETETIIFHYWKAIQVNGELKPGPISIIEIDL